MTTATNKIPNRSNWDCLLSLELEGNNILKDKQALIRSYINEMFKKTSRIFEYDGLEGTQINAWQLERLTQFIGYSFIADVKKPLSPYKEGLYALKGFAGGILDPNLLPTMATINNVALGYNAIIEINKDCVLFKNDSAYEGLNPLFNRYANLLADIVISLRYALVNSRIPNVMQGDSQELKTSLDDLYKDIDNGTKIGAVVVSNPFFDGLKNAVATGSKENLIQELIEAYQYIKANWYLDMGLQSNFNMKREAINESEASMNDDTLIPMIDDMLKCRQENCEAINKMFGTNISVKLSSAWEKVHNDYKKEDSPDTKEGKEETSEVKENETN